MRAFFARRAAGGQGTMLPEQRPLSTQELDVLAHVADRLCTATEELRRLTFGMKADIRESPSSSRNKLVLFCEETLDLYLRIETLRLEELAAARVAR